MFDRLFKYFDTLNINSSFCLIKISWLMSANDGKWQDIDVVNSRLVK